LRNLVTYYHLGKSLGVCVFEKKNPTKVKRKKEYQAMQGRPKGVEVPTNESWEGFESSKGN
jgi:hypothetical protein